MSVEAADAAAQRLASASARLRALQERADRLRSGVPVSQDDITSAQLWATAQTAETGRARDRLDIAQTAAARRHLETAALLEASGHHARAENLRRLAGRYQAAVRGPARGTDTARSASEAAPGVTVDSGFATTATTSIPPSEWKSVETSGSPGTMISHSRQLALANERLRALLIGVDHLGTRRPSGKAAERRRELWGAVLERCGDDKWHGWVHAVCAVGAAALPSVDGTTVCLYDGQSADPIAASGSWAESIEEVQQVLGEGPGATACRSGTPVLVSDPAELSRRWPAYASATASSGLGSVWAVPLKVGEAAVGVVTFLRRSRSTAATEELNDVATLTDLTLAAVMGDRDQTTGILHPDVSPAFLDIHIAAGMIAYRMGITATEAMLRLRAYAFGSGHRLRAVAAMVISGETPPI